MRAKEYISQNQQTIKHLEDVQRIINDLMPLRLNKEATDEYYNRILSADIRRQKFLLQKDLFDKKNAMQQDEPLEEKFPDEIPIEKVIDVKETLFQVIKEDESFGYMFFILGTEQNIKHKGEPIDCIPNSEAIKKAIFEYRDDYPKESLDLYLDDSINYEQYEYLTNSRMLADDDEKLLEFFNTSYKIYDDVRCLKSKISEIRNYLKKLTFDGDDKKFAIIKFVIGLIEKFNSEDSQLERCKKEFLRLIESIKDKYETVELKSSLQLNSAKGTRVNFIRVVNVLYELGFFQGPDKKTLSKKDVFAAFGKMLNANFTSFQNDLSTTQAASNADQKSLTKIFEEMLEKQKELINK